MRTPKAPATPQPKRRSITRTSRMWFAPAAPVPSPATKRVREKKPKVKNDPKLVAAAREMRDRWLEQVNAGQAVIEGAGKYDVSRSVCGADFQPELPALPEAA